MPRIHCLGFGLVTCDRILLLDEFPQPNQKLVIHDWREQIGGPVAVGLMTMAALDVRVHWGLPLENGSNSSRVRAQFRSLGVTYSEASRRDDDDPTPEALILVHRQSGERTVLLLHPPAQLRERTEAVAGQWPAADWIYCDGRDERLVFALKDWARENQSKLFFDLGSLRPNWRAIVAGSEIVIVSDDFMLQLNPGLTPAQTLQHVVDCGVKIAGMTLGKEGSLFLHAGKYLKIPAYPAKDVVDTTNAGDVFHGAFLAAWIKTSSIAQSAAFASRCGAWAVEHIGHNLNHIDREIKSFLHDHLPNQLLPTELQMEEVNS